MALHNLKVRLHQNQHFVDIRSHFHTSLPSLHTKSEEPESFKKKRKKKEKMSVIPSSVNLPSTARGDSTPPEKDRAFELSTLPTRSQSQQQTEGDICIQTQPRLTPLQLALCRSEGEVGVICCGFLQSIHQSSYWFNQPVFLRLWAPRGAVVIWTCKNKQVNVQRARSHWDTLQNTFTLKKKKKPSFWAGWVVNAHFLADQWVKINGRHWERKTRWVHTLQGLKFSSSCGASHASHTQR